MRFCEAPNPKNLLRTRADINAGGRNPRNRDHPVVCPTETFSADGPQYAADAKWAAPEGAAHFGSRSQGEEISSDAIGNRNYG
jgi:hypothetical protein